MKKVDISVVVPSYNEEKFLPLCLKSLLKQDFKGTYEVIVVDNASKDNTTSILKKFKVKSFHIRLKGVTIARDVGFKKAVGEIIVSTDADTIVPNNWLSEIYKRFKEDKELVGISGSASFWDGNFLDNLFIFPHIGYNYLNYIFKIGFFSGYNMAVRKRVFEKIGGFDLDKKSAEDLDLCLKLQKIGKIKYYPTVQVKTSARKLRHKGYLKYASYNVYNQIRVSILKMSPLPMEDIREFRHSHNFAFRKKISPLIMLYSFLLNADIQEVKEIVKKGVSKKVLNKITNNLNLAVNKIKEIDVETFFSLKDN